MSRNQLLVVLSVLFGGWMLSSCSSGEKDLLDDIKDRNVLRVVTDSDYSPQSKQLSNGTWEGFDVDVATEIAKKLGVRVELIAAIWTEVEGGNWGDKWDINVGSMTVTTERQDRFYFVSPPYYFTPAVYGASPTANIHSLSDLNGKAICVATDTTYEAYLGGDLTIPPSRIFQQPPTGVSVLTENVEQDCVDGIVAGNKGYSIMLSSTTVVDMAITEGKLVRVDPMVFVEDLAVDVDKTLSRDSKRLRDEIGDIIQQMHSNGTLSSFSDKWFGLDRTVDPTK